jgi:hypothetical protein
VKTVTLTEQEIVALRNMLDVALKTLGRPAVAAFSALDNKLALALREKPPVTTEPKVKPKVAKK